MAWIGNERGFLAIPADEPSSSKKRPVSDERPAPPSPEQFGLTKEQVYNLKEFPGEMKWHRNLFITYYVVAVCFFILQPHELSVSNIIFSLLKGAGVILFPGMFIHLYVFEIISWFRIRLSPDYPKYRGYRKAYDAWQQELVEWTRRQVSWWQSLSGRSFEHAVGMVFQRRGYDVRHTGASGDGGIDLIIRKGEENVIVQCKAHNKPVGPAAIRDCYGTLLHQRAKKAIVVASHGFSRQARDFALGKPIELWDANMLIRELSVEKVAS